MLRTMLLAVVALAMLVVAPLVGASNSLSLESVLSDSDASTNSQKDLSEVFDDVDQNSDEVDDRWDEARQDREDFWAENNDRDDDEENNDREDDEWRDRDDDEHPSERLGDYNPYGEGNPRGGGQYEWR